VKQARSLADSAGNLSRVADLSIGREWWKMRAPLASRGLTASVAPVPLKELLPRP